MKKELFAESVRNEIINKVEAMIGTDERIEFIITGEDMKSVYTRLASNPITNLVPMGLGSNPIVTKSQEYIRLFFTNKGIVIVGLDYYRQPLNYELVEYTNIKSAVLHEKDGILELTTTLGTTVAITLVDSRKADSIKKITSKLNLEMKNTRFESKSRKIFNLEVVGGLALAALIIVAVGVKGFLIG